jgi:hypothetical protein
MADSALKIQCDGDLFNVPIRVAERSASAAFAVDPPVVDFGELEVGLYLSQTLSIRSLSARKLAIVLILPKRSSFKCPATVALQPGGVADVEVEFSPVRSMLIEETLLLMSDGEAAEVLLRGEGVASRDDIVVSQGDIVVFPECSIGVIRRARIKIANRTSIVNRIRAKTTQPFVCPIADFSIEPHSFVLFPVHFAPRVEGRFDGTVQFTTNARKTTAIDLRGVCTGA